ncbi:Disulphide bond corrector protein DsbC [Acidocella aminolytica 101 = DSM 11237]|uniref:Thiol:disulfide interchange protein DsbD N-terminal domain-containing protein n=2 Tax=Acidocella TaxID=50709 RepID=A0A0D6PG58_9PROT|nr:protein-disulfide reductase DsbD domain-containing protein [Acidocella aminolytica]GAN80755.1 hypothetical protein Aam_057_003 [Acidocella aminolytica 101 = DSM 11237]GBQ32735.1 hypothetical protein AA11237_0238 [Acidocella aminolytica 101 = DSM 11237]SHF63136.1 Disulphide bond corrector protein DsbC [Acidocella aminolytica 101 = DSM 11237]
MTRKYWYVASTIIAVFAILAGGRYVSHAPSTHGPIATPDGTNGKKGEFHMPTSVDKVNVTVHLALPRESPASPAVLVVRLDIRKGWHVNANPASLPFLIPTVEKATIAGSPVALDIAYPRGRNSHIVLQGTAIRVYNNGTVLKASLSGQVLDRFKATGSLILRVAVQSCSDKGICLPPATLISSLPYHS